MLKTLFKRVAGMARRVLPLLGLAVVGAGAAAEPAPLPRQIDIADYRPYLADDHPVRQGMRRFAALVQAGSHGELQVRVRSDALPGTPAQQIAAMQAGSAGVPALMLVASTGLAAQAPEFALLDLPFLVRDGQQADAVLDGAFGDALLARLAPAGLVGLAWWENGFRQVTSSRGPIRRAEDLRGLDLRVIGEPVFIDTVRAMGANPIPLPFGELHAALKSRRVAAQDNFISQILAGRLYEVQSALSVTNHSYSPLVLIANADAWNALTAAQRRVLHDAAAQAGRAQRAIARDEASAGRAALARHGMVVNDVPAFELARLRTLTAPLRERYFGLVGGDLRQLYDAATSP